MSFTLPKCAMCGKEVEGRTATIDTIFVEGGEEQVLETIALSCGCVVQFPSYEVCVKEGIVGLKNAMTGQVVLEWFDDEMLVGDD